MPAASTTSDPEVERQRQAVRRYWDAHPIATDRVSHAAGTAESLDAIPEEPDARTGAFCPDGPSEQVRERRRHAVALRRRHFRRRVLDRRLASCARHGGRLPFEGLEEFEFQKTDLKYFPLPWFRGSIEKRWGFFLQMTARKPAGATS